jgi:hypothetical protein
VSCQLPVASQICFWLLAQRVAPGAHEPLHAPALQP